jgi:hypothetical protein
VDEQHRTFAREGAGGEFEILDHVYPSPRLAPSDEDRGPSDVRMLMSRCKG